MRKNVENNEVGKLFKFKISQVPDVVHFQDISISSLFAVECPNFTGLQNRILFRILLLPLSYKCDQYLIANQDGRQQ